jgi:hypothetical protein
MNRGLIEDGSRKKRGWIQDGLRMSREGRKVECRMDTR